LFLLTINFFAGAYKDRVRFWYDGAMVGHIAGGNAKEIEYLLDHCSGELSGKAAQFLYRQS
jgi:hypothetical protein